MPSLPSDKFIAVLIWRLHKLKHIGSGMDPHEMDFAGEGSVEDVFCQNFTASQAGVGEVLSVSLCDGGDLRMVTEENRREFVELYVNYVLNKSIHRQVNFGHFLAFHPFTYPARSHHASAACNRREPWFRGRGIRWRLS